MRRDFQFGLIAGTLITVVFLVFYGFSGSRSSGEIAGAASATASESKFLTPLRAHEQGHLPEGRQELLERLEQLRQRPSSEDASRQEGQQAKQPTASESEKTSPGLPQSPKPDKPQAQKYTVASGDTLSAISKRFYGTSTKWQVILDANRNTIKNPAGLKPGMELVIPAQ